MVEKLLLYNFISLNLGFILDLIVGDPKYKFHPIILLGKLNMKLEQKFYQDNKASGVFVVLISLSVLIIVIVLLIILFTLNEWLYLIISILISSQIFATKSLYQAGLNVYVALNNQGVEAARDAVGMIVGRSTEKLNEEEIISACIESVIENTSDGICAPLLYMSIGLNSLGLVYKDINTMDSMFGYKNDKYINFGYFSAKLDDFINYVPARISALLMIIASFFLGYDYKNAFRIFKRDHRNHLSPNAGQLESVCAGALNIQLGGTHTYFNKAVFKPTIGDKEREVKRADIIASCHLMVITSILTLLFVDVIYIVIGVLIYGI